MEQSLIYVSRKSVPGVNSELALEEIVRGSQSRNATLHVTGALASTDLYFVQVLEGPSVALDELMHSIDRDLRHNDVNVLEVCSIAKRSFSDWSMAYCGTSNYVARQIELATLASSSLRATRIDRLRSLLVGLAVGN